MNVSSFAGWIGQGLFTNLGDRNAAVISTSAFQGDSFQLEYYPLMRVETDVASYESGSDYQKETSLEVKGSIDIGIASASGRYSESKSLMKTSNSSVVRADIEVEHSNWMLRTADLRLTEDAKTILTLIPSLPNATPEQIGDEIERRFRETYGDYFCSGVTLGGYLDTNMILESSAERSSKRTALTVKVKVLFVKKTHSESSFSQSETEDVRISLAINDSTASEGISYEGKPGVVVTPTHLSRMIADMTDRIKNFSSQLFTAVEEDIARGNRERAVLSGFIDRKLVMYYHMTPFSATTEYRTLRELAVRNSVMRQEAMRFFAIEVAYVSSIIRDLRNSALDLSLDGEDVEPSVIRTFEEAELPRINQLPSSFDLDEEFWNLDLCEKFLTLGEE